ncbi:MAG: hypothetical protein JHC93_06790 [Parachlamydiales bacterium]|nr:hypothetical protein [Parachlamydiales bacterium]
MSNSILSYFIGDNSNTIGDIQEQVNADTTTQTGNLRSRVVKSCLVAATVVFESVMGGLAYAAINHANKLSEVASQDCGLNNQSLNVTQIHEAQNSPECVSSNNEASLFFNGGTALVCTMVALGLIAGVSFTKKQQSVAHENAPLLPRNLA